MLEFPRYSKTKKVGKVQSRQYAFTCTKAKIMQMSICLYMHRLSLEGPQDSDNNDCL